MTDKQFIETLKNIQQYCSNTNCDDCKFCDKYNPMYDTECVLIKMGSELGCPPRTWNILLIEKLLGEER